MLARVSGAFVKRHSLLREENFFVFYNILPSSSRIASSPHHKHRGAYANLLHKSSALALTSTETTPLNRRVLFISTHCAARSHESRPTYTRLSLQWCRPSSGCDHHLKQSRLTVRGLEYHLPASLTSSGHLPQPRTRSHSTFEVVRSPHGSHKFTTAIICASDTTLKTNYIFEKRKDQKSQKPLVKQRKK
jgi:hypothetical protein